MLRLKALHLRDFGPFKGEQTVEFSPEDGVEIVYGENMRGKTSLLNAIRFAFFGTVLGRGAKHTELHKIQNWEQAEAGQFGFQVRLDFSASGHDYTLTRVCAPRKEVDLPSSDTDYTVEHYLERDGDVLGPDQTKAELKRILPSQIARFFLFDGELLQEYEDLLIGESDMGRRISNAIERILGVPILTQARASALRLKEKSEKQEASSAQGDQKTAEFGNQLANLHAERDVLKADLLKLQEDLEQLRIEKARLEESLKRRERYATLMEKRDGLDRQVNELVARQDKTENEIGPAMSTAWCAVLRDRMRNAVAAVTDRQRELNSQLVRVRVLRDLQSDSSETCPACLQPITPEVRRQLEGQGTADGDAIAKQEDELAELGARKKVLEELLESSRSEVLKLRWEASEETAVEIAAKKEELREIQRQLENVDEADLREDKAAFEKVVKKIDATERGIAKTQEDIDTNNSNAERIQKKLDKLAGSDLQRARVRRNFYGKLHHLLDDAVAAYRDQLRQRVEMDATNLFRALTTEPDYDGLRINDNYGLTIIHKDGATIPIRSAGAEHVVALCLVGALQKNAPLQGPIIIDSPFGRLDHGHTTNIVAALPDMAKQVMLLVYEDELPAALARSNLKGRLKAEWRLERRSARHTVLTPRRD